MSNIFDYILELKSKGYNIGFTCNDLGIVSFVQYYNEYVNGRKIYGTKKKNLVNVSLEECINETEAVYESIVSRLIKNSREDY